MDNFISQSSVNNNISESNISESMHAGGDTNITNSENLFKSNIDKSVEMPFNNSFNGLNLLCDPRKKKNNCMKTSTNKFNIDIKSFNIDIEDFKKFMIGRLENYSMNKNSDFYDDSILGCYYHFIFRKIDKNKLSNFLTNQ